MIVEIEQVDGTVITVPADEQQVIDVAVEQVAVVVEVPGLKGSPGKGVPIGGVEGQFLVKSSGDDYDTEWVDLEDPSGAVKFDEAQTLSNEEKERARDNIGARSADEILPVEYGGTGGVTPASARQGLGLIYASTKEAEDGLAANRIMSPLRTRHAIETSNLFATAAQGAKADTALQPGAKIPVTDITTGAGTPVVVGRRGSSGAMGTISLEYTAIQNTVPLRGEGGIIGVGTPTGPTHATPKSYVDAAIGNIQGFSGDYNDLTNKPDLSEINTIKTRLDGSTLYITNDGSEP